MRGELVVIAVLVVLNVLLLYRNGAQVGFVRVLLCACGLLKSGRAAAVDPTRARARRGVADAQRAAPGTRGTQPQRQPRPTQIICATLEQVAAAEAAASARGAAQPGAVGQRAGRAGSAAPADADRTHVPRPRTLCRADRAAPKVRKCLAPGADLREMGAAAAAVRAARAPRVVRPQGRDLRLAPRQLPAGRRRNADVWRASLHARRGGRHARCGDSREQGPRLRTRRQAGGPAAPVQPRGREQAGGPVVLGGDPGHVDLSALDGEHAAENGAGIRRLAPLFSPARSVGDDRGRGRPRCSCPTGPT